MARGDAGWSLQLLVVMSGTIACRLTVTHDGLVSLTCSSAEGEPPELSLLALPQDVVCLLAERMPGLAALALGACSKLLREAALSDHSWRERLRWELGFTAAGAARWPGSPVSAFLYTTLKHEPLEVSELRRMPVRAYGWRGACDVRVCLEFAQRWPFPIWTFLTPVAPGAAAPWAGVAELSHHGLGEILCSRFETAAGGRETHVLSFPREQGDRWFEPLMAEARRLRRACPLAGARPTFAPTPAPAPALARTPCECPHRAHERRAGTVAQVTQAGLLELGWSQLRPYARDEQGRLRGAPAVLAVALPPRRGLTVLSEVTLRIEAQARRLPSGVPAPPTLLLCPGCRARADPHPMPPARPPRASLARPGLPRHAPPRPAPPPPLQSWAAAEASGRLELEVLQAADVACVGGEPAAPAPPRTAPAASGDRAVDGGYVIPLEEAVATAVEAAEGETDPFQPWFSPVPRGGEARADAAYTRSRPHCPVSVSAHAFVQKGRAPPRKLTFTALRRTRATLHL